MKKFYSFPVVLILLILTISGTGFGQKVLIGPRLTGNYNIYNERGLAGSWSAIGIGIGGTVDVSFNNHIGLMANLTFFDMRNWGNTITNRNQSTEYTRTLSYLTIDPMFKVEFARFYMVAGPSLGIKLGSSGENTTVNTGQTPNIVTVNLDTKTARFDIATGAGYSFKLSDDMYLGTDFLVYIPITDTYNFPGLSNSIFTLKLGVSLKFKI